MDLLTLADRAISRAWRALAFLTAAAALSACASGSQAALPASHVPVDAARPHRFNATLDLRVRIPKKKHARSRLDPRYVSAATAGMTMAFSGQSSFTEVFGLTTHDPNCTGAPLTCTFAISLAAGSYTVTVDTYDRAPVSGAIPANAKLLSTARNMPLAVVTGTANHADFTLDGVPASIVVGGFPSAGAGTAFSKQSFSTTVEDADGDVIVGTYTTPVTLADHDTSGATSIATSGNDNPPANELLGSSDQATISYTGQTIRTPVTIAASAGPVTGSGLFVVTLPLYVADYSNNEVKEIPPFCTTSGCVITLGGSFTFSLPEGVAVDASGNVYVADTFNNDVQEMPPGCASSMCVTTIGGGFAGPAGVAVDASENVFVADYANHAVKEIPAGCTASTCVTTLGGGINNPSGVALDASGDVFVTDYLSATIKEIPSGCTTSTCVVSLGGGFTRPVGVAVDGSGNVFVADLDNDTVTEMPSGCASVSCVTPIGGTFGSPTGAAVDAAGNVFTTDSDGVQEIPRGCADSSCVTTLGGGFSNPWAVTL